MFGRRLPGRAQPSRLRLRALGKPYDLGVRADGSTGAHQETFLAYNRARVTRFAWAR